MSITIIDPPQTGDLFHNRRRWTREDCEFMERVGLLKNRYELIDGEIVEKVGQNRPHVLGVMRATRWLMGVFGETYIQCQADIEVATKDQPTNHPQPDVAVLKRPLEEYAATPSGSDTRLIVEVSDTTLADDLRVKAGLYARALVPEYWVLDVTSQRLIVHRAPQSGIYTAIHAFTAQDTIAPEGAPDAVVAVAALLPPAAAVGPV